MTKLHFQKKFSKKPPPAVIVAMVKNNNFSEKLETYGTALSNKTDSFRIKKTELLKPINLNRKVKKGDIIAKLKSGNIIAPFSLFLMVSELYIEASMQRTFLLDSKSPIIQPNALMPLPTTILS